MRIISSRPFIERCFVTIPLAPSVSNLYISFSSKSEPVKRTMAFSFIFTSFFRISKIYIPLKSGRAKSSSTMSKFSFFNNSSPSRQLVIKVHSIPIECIKKSNYGLIYCVKNKINMYLNLNSSIALIFLKRTLSVISRLYPYQFF